MNTQGKTCNRRESSGLVWNSPLRDPSSNSGASDGQVQLGLGTRSFQRSFTKTTSGHVQKRALVDHCDFVSFGAVPNLSKTIAARKMLPIPAWGLPAIQPGLLDGAHAVRLAGGAT
jgi:hypothetical protein